MTWTPDTSKLDAERARKAAAQTADLEMFRPLPHNGTATSKAAAERAGPNAGTQRWQILCALESKAMTRRELVDALGLLENAINPRCNALIGDDLIETVGTRNGRSILQLTAKGRAVLAQKDAA
jgi:DNA-binding MarR family transcriptional regulator